MATLSIPEQTAQQTRKTVLIVDDHPLLRQGLALLINHHLGAFRP